MKLILLIVGTFIFVVARSQSRMALIKKSDTLIYHSNIIRNNLTGQEILFRDENGTLYRMEQDGMPCYAPKNANGAFMPNVFAPKKPFHFVTPMPVVPQKKELPKFVPKKPGSF